MASQIITVKIPRDALQKLADAAKVEIENMKNSLSDKERELDGYLRALSPKQESIASMPLSLSKDTKDGRARRGDSQRVILEFLTARKGQQFKQAEVSEKTGVTASSTYRILQKLSKSGSLKNTGNLYSA